MTIDDLVTLFRKQIQDELTTVDADDTYATFSEDEILQYARAAELEFCRQTDHLADSSTVALTQLTVTADDPWVDISHLVTKIREARLVTAGRHLELVSLAAMEEFVWDDYGYQNGLSNDWEDQTGTPRCVIMDLETNKLRLFPTPTANDTLRLRIYRLPVNDVSCGADLEITDDHRYYLSYYMRHLAHQKADSEVQDEKLADMYLERWQQYLFTVNKQVKVRRNRHHTVRYGGY